MYLFLIQPIVEISASQTLCDEGLAFFFKISNLSQIDTFKNTTKNIFLEQFIDHTSLPTVLHVALKGLLLSYLNTPSILSILSS